MNWENSRALTPLKRDFLAAFFARNAGFFLTGGSALGVFYFAHRLSYDLDFFTTDDRVNWHLVDNDARAAARAIGADLRSITVSPSFRRHTLIRGTESEILDFVHEQAPQLDEHKDSFGIVRVDTLRDILANKIGTLVGRCEKKDIVDLFFLERHGWRALDHLDDARRKEGGIDPAVIAHLLQGVHFERLPDYMIADVAPAELEAFTRRLEREFSTLAFPER